MWGSGEWGVGSGVFVRNLISEQKDELTDKNPLIPLCDLCLLRDLCEKFFAN
jgi:hypothetical protein